MRGNRVCGSRGFGARLGRGAKSLDGEPGARNVGRRGGVANPPSRAEDAEDIEDVVSVVGQGKWVDQGVEVNG